jgi:hypothetical protein
MSDLMANETGTFARVNRGALRTIAERAGKAVTEAAA